MIEVSHLSRHFGTFRAVDDISFSIPTGQIVGLLGPNGAGKSTTMRMITGFLNSTSGKILIDGIDIVENPVAAKRKIGYMPESAPMYSDMIVADYLKYVAEIYNQDAETKVPHLCHLCGLKEVMHKNISELSRGYKQRVGLAHALMNDPEILILDEPTSGLDPNQVEDVRDIIREIGKTRTVIVSTHILSEVETLCSRAIIISGGKVVADSSIENLKNSIGTSTTVFVEFTGKVKDAEAAATSIPEVANVSSNKIENGHNEIVVSVNGQAEIRPALVKNLVEKGCDIYAMATQSNSLEDVFHALTEAK